MLFKHREMYYYLINHLRLSSPSSFISCDADFQGDILICQMPCARNYGVLTVRELF